MAVVHLSATSCSWCRLCTAEGYWYFTGRLFDSAVLTKTLSPPNEIYLYLPGALASQLGYVQALSVLLATLQPVPAGQPLRQARRLLRLLLIHHRVDPAEKR